MAKQEQMPTISVHRDDDKDVLPISEMIKVEYTQEVAQKPDLAIEICLAFVDNKPCVAMAVLEKGRLKPEQYQVDMLSIVQNVVWGREQMRQKSDPPAETKTKGGLILPPGVEGN